VGQEEGKDITADAFLHLWQIKKQFPSLQKIKTFLQVCVRNASINSRKKKEYEEFRKREIYDSFEIRDLDPEQQLVKSGILEAIAREIEKLPAGAKRIMKLSCFEGLDSKTIAARLKISESTVRNQKQRAIGILKFAIQGMELCILFFSFTSWF
jgi:RNA polymerase sigma-70 factor (ECF subfamily)